MNKIIIKEPEGCELHIPDTIRTSDNCSHGFYGSYPYYMMKAPTCFDCGQSMPDFDFSFYESLIEEDRADGTNWVENPDGSYTNQTRVELKQKLERLENPQSIWSIIKETFFNS